MSASTVAGRMHALPLPLAQLLRRAANGKSPVERHHNAFYLAEATLKLAAAARVGLWIDRALEPGGPLARSLEALTLPSVGHWRDFLRDVDRALGERRDAALLPLGDALGRLARRRPDGERVSAFAEAAAEAGTVSAEVARSAGRDGVIGFFNLIVAYRNDVMGHGAQRGNDYYERFAQLLLDALDDVLGAPELLGGCKLAHARLVVESAGEATIAWQDLTGLAGLPLAGAPTTRVAPGQLYLVGAGAVIPLHPLAVYREDDLGRESVAFLNKTVRRTRRAEGAPVEEVRRADYLDYSTGENWSDVDAREPLTALLGKLRGKSASPDDLSRAQDASVAAAGQEAPVETVTAGTTLGDFEIEGEIGRGGMGIVYRARQRSLNRVVALKVLPPALAADRVTVERFRREVAALGRADHPNVVKILTSGVDGDRLYYAMEFVEGADLGQVSGLLSRWKSTGAPLREGHLRAAVTSSGGGARVPAPTGPEPEPVLAVPSLTGGRDLYTRLAELCADAALGLDHLHERGIVHRDVKPSNLMLTADGQRVVVMDLGLARLLDESAALTGSDVKVLGTLRYMAPEQAQRRRLEVDRRADVYGLGASLYELATGRAIFDGDTETRLLTQVLSEEPTAPRRVDKRLPRDLATIVTVATAKEPARRYPTAAAMAADLRAFAERRPISAAPPGVIDRLRHLTRRNRAATAALATVALLGAVSGGWFWRWNSIKVRCFAADPFTRVPSPIRPLTDEERRHRAFSFCFQERRGRYVRRDRVNSVGELRDDENGSSTNEYQYDDAGALRAVTTRDHNGKINGKAIFSADGTRVNRRDAEDNPLPWRASDASVFLRTYDARGHITSERYANVFGSPRTDDQKAYGYDVVTDDNGLIVESRALGPDGKPQPTGDGMASRVARYDEWGNIIQDDNRDVDGKPVFRSNGYVSARYRADRWGNVVEERYLDATGAPLMRSDGYASGAMIFDDRGNMTEARYLGLDGKLTLNKWGNAIVRRKSDERGNLTELRFLDAAERPAIQADGCAMTRAQWDARGNQMESACFDGADRPITNGAGYHKATREYDARGNLVRLAFFGPDGRAVFRKGGYAALERTYDARDRLIEERLFGTDGKPFLDAEGKAIFRTRFDERGRSAEESYLGVHREPVIYTSGCSSWTFRRDESGQMITQTCLDTDGKLRADSSGVSVYTYGYDDRGNRTEIAYLDRDRKPMTRKEGYAALRRKHDVRGNLLEEEVLDVAGKRISTKENRPLFRKKYDAFGRIVEEAWFDAEGKPVRNVKNVARQTWEYDARGHQVAGCTWDIDGKPALLDGYQASFRRTFDERGNRTEHASFGADGKPAAGPDGVATVRNRYDRADNKLDYATFDVAGRPVAGSDGCATTHYEYDGAGHLVEHRCFDAAGAAALEKSGWAIWRTRYDAHGLAVEERFFGVGGEPNLHPDPTTHIPMAGFLRVRVPPDGIPYQLLFGLHGEAIAGTGYDANGRFFRWRLEQDKIVVVDDKNQPIADAVARANMERRAAAYRKALDWSALRDKEPARFRGAAGLLVEDLVPGGQAERLGIRPGDVLLEHDGHKLDTNADFIQSVDTMTHEAAQLHILQDGRAIALDIKKGRVGVFIDPLP